MVSVKSRLGSVVKTNRSEHDDRGASGENERSVSTKPVSTSRPTRGVFGANFINGYLGGGATKPTSRVSKEPAYVSKIENSSWIFFLERKSQRKWAWKAAAWFRLSKETIQAPAIWKVVLEARHPVAESPPAECDATRSIRLRVNVQTFYFFKESRRFFF